jgi:hypothetical protein
VQDYFGAKRRVFEGAGYPADTAGIMRMPAELGNAAKPAA